MPRINVKDKRKQQLIDANMASIAKRGLVDTTIAHVSDGANMSRGIVNFYFTSKEKMMQETLAALIAEQNACWQEALAAAAKQDPLGKIDAMMRALMGDKLCSARRLAVLSAFIGHAGTHVGYAKLIRAADDLFTKQVKTLLQQAGIEAKQAEMRARQMLSFIRGHQVVAFLNADWGKPSHYADQWLGIVSGWAGAIAPVAAPAPAEKAKVTPKEPVKEPVKETVKEPVAEKVAKPETIQEAPPKPKKQQGNALPGQLDFGDLFARQ